MKTNTKINLTIIVTSILSGLLTLPITFSIVKSNYTSLWFIPIIFLVVVIGFKYFKKLVGEYKDERR